MKSQKYLKFIVTFIIISTERNFNGDIYIYIYILPLLYQTICVFGLCLYCVSLDFRLETLNQHELCTD